MSARSCQNRFIGEVTGRLADLAHRSRVHQGLSFAAFVSMPSRIESGVKMAEGVGIGTPTAKPLILQGFGRLNLIEV